MTAGRGCGFQGRGFVLEFKKHYCLPLLIMQARKGATELPLLPLNEEYKRYYRMFDLSESRKPSIYRGHGSHLVDFLSVYSTLSYFRTISTNENRAHHQLEMSSCSVLSTQPILIYFAFLISAEIHAISCVKVRITRLTLYQSNNRVLHQHLCICRES